MPIRRPEFTKQYAFSVSVSCGVIYGIFAQVFARLKLLSPVFMVMSIGYVFVLPIVLGAIAVGSHPSRVSGWRAVGLALTTSITCLLVSLAVGWEGTIC